MVRGCNPRCSSERNAPPASCWPCPSAPFALCYTCYIRAICTLWILAVQGKMLAYISARGAHEHDVHMTLCRCCCFFRFFCCRVCCCCAAYGVHCFRGCTHWEKSISLEIVGLNVLDVDRGHRILSIRVRVCVYAKLLCIGAASAARRPPMHQHFALIYIYFCWFLLSFPVSRCTQSCDNATEPSRCRANTAMTTDVRAKCTLAGGVMGKCHARNEFIRLKYSFVLL